MSRVSHSQTVSLREQYYIKGDGFVLVYSIDNTNRFHALKGHRDGILGLRTGKKTNMVMAGNKCDLVDQRQIPTEEATKLAQEWGIPFFETSAQNNINVTELFQAIARELIKTSNEAAAPAAMAVETEAASANASETGTPAQSTGSGSQKSGCCVLF